VGVEELVVVVVVVLLEVEVLKVVVGSSKSTKCGSRKALSN